MRTRTRTPYLIVLYPVWLAAFVVSYYGAYMNAVVIWLGRAHFEPILPETTSIVMLAASLAMIWWVAGTYVDEDHRFLQFLQSACMTIQAILCFFGAFWFIAGSVHINDGNGGIAIAIAYPLLVLSLFQPRSPFQLSGRNA